MFEQFYRHGLSVPQFDDVGGRLRPMGDNFLLSLLFVKFNFPSSVDNIALISQGNQSLMQCTPSFPAHF